MKNVYYCANTVRLLGKWRKKEKSRKGARKCKKRIRENLSVLLNCDKFNNEKKRKRDENVQNFKALFKKEASS